jgi:hypothetical protein
MFVLPPTRNEFPCKNKRTTGAGLCDQMIYKDDKDGLVKNMADGRGGLRDERHLCPERVGSKFHHYDEVNMREYDYQQRNFPCPCGIVYNKEVFPICPSCMRLECRKCGNLQNWLAHLGIFCFVCGAQCDPRSVKYAEPLK